MKKFLVSIIAISVATGAMAASTLVSSGENKSAPSATYRAGSLRANKGVTESVITTPAAKNQEIGRIGTISTKKITVSSNKNTGGTTGGTQTGGSSSNNTNAGAMTNAAIQQQLDAFSLRIDRAYDAASLAADSVVSAQNVINGMRDDLEDVKNHITSLQGDSDTNITELVSRIETLQRNLNGLEGNLNTLSANTVALNTFTQQVGTLNQKIEDVKGTTEQLTNAGYLTPASISDLTSRVDNAIATIGTMQETLATKMDIANMATQQYVNDAKQAAMNYADEAKAVANSYTDIKVSSSIGSNNEAIKQYVDAKVGTGDNVSAKDYIDTTIAAKVGDTGSYASARAYTDAKTSGMATKTFVNNRIGLDDVTGGILGIDTTPTVKQYVDSKDGSTRNWVSDNVVGPIQNATVKAYIDGKFDDAADPENPNGWGSHFKEVNDGLLVLGQSVDALDKDNKENKDNNKENKDRIDALDQDNKDNKERIDTLDQDNKNNKDNIEALDKEQKENAASLGESIGKLNEDYGKLDERITTNTNELKQKLDTANFASELGKTDAFINLDKSVKEKMDVASFDSILSNNETFKGLQQNAAATENALKNKLDINSFGTELSNNAMFANVQQDLNSTKTGLANATAALKDKADASTVTQLSDTVAAIPSTYATKSDVASTYATKSAVDNLNSSIVTINNSMVTNEDLTAAVNSAVTAAFAEGGVGYNATQTQVNATCNLNGGKEP